MFSRVSGVSRHPAPVPEVEQETTAKQTKSALVASKVVEKQPKNEGEKTSSKKRKWVDEGAEESREVKRQKVDGTVNRFRAMIPKKTGTSEVEQVKGGLVKAKRGITVLQIFLSTRSTFSFIPGVKTMGDSTMKEKIRYNIVAPFALSEEKSQEFTHFLFGNISDFLPILKEKISLLDEKSSHDTEEYTKFVAEVVDFTEEDMTTDGMLAILQSIA